MTRRSKAKKLKILIAGGGTGGHLFPGVAIAEEFMEQLACDIRFVGTKRGLESKVIPKTPFKLYTIPISGLYRVGLKRKMLTLVKLPFAFLKSLWIILSFRPQLVIGIGGYASGPVLAIAIALRKNTIIQEQNAYPGMTNRILGKWVHLAFVPFDQSRRLFRNPMVVGNPIRKNIKDSAPTTHSTLPEKTIISIIGGSQGAHAINKAFAGILQELSQEPRKFGIIHQSGVSDKKWLEQEYNNCPALEAKVVEFVDDMVELYQQSHLIISRAGSTINEIIAMGKASILIPIAVSSGNHQKENARVMEEAKAAIMIEEKDLTPEKLFGTIQELITNPESLIEMGEKARGLYGGDSAHKIVSGIRSQFNLY